MRVNNHQFIIAVDIDGTLVRRFTDNDPYNCDKPPIDIINPYDNKAYSYLIHDENIELLRMSKARGFYIKAWSAAGSGHAESVIRALGLDDGTVDEVETKCCKHIDDSSDILKIIGPRVFIPKIGWSET